MNEQMIEVLIGKFIDSEITPAEQQLLDAELSRNPETRRLLEDLQSLRDQAKGMLRQELCGSSDSAAEVFAAAMRSDRSERAQHVKRGRAWGVAAALVAACFIVGTGVNKLFFSEGISGTQEGTGVKSSGEPGGGEGLVFNGDRKPGFNPAKPVDRTIDWYTYTDADGVGWLMETYRHHRPRKVVPAAYLEGL